MNRELAIREPEPLPQATLEGAGEAIIPATVATAGDEAAYRFFEFFTARIPNRNTRRAYYRACCRFFAWTQAKRLSLGGIKPPRVAAYLEELLATPKSRNTVKQALSALTGLYDWLVVGQVVPNNPAASVKGPKHVVKKGTTPVLVKDEMRELLDSIDTSHVVGLRDRALIALRIATNSPGSLHERFGIRPIVAVRPGAWMA